jgi:hypothetical protein
MREVDLWLLDRSVSRPPLPDSSVADRGQADDDSGAPLRCAACGAAITDRRSAISVGESHEHTFVNPAGIIYRVRCFSAAPGCSEKGTFTAELSWFPGFGWRYAFCSSCEEHLGWVYRSAGGESFFGLIAEKLVEP